jgi:hypothetical protein
MAASNPTSSSEIFSVNPYENHPSLTQIEAEVLWEYAKLNQHIKDVRTLLLILWDRSSVLPIIVGPPNTLFERHT